MAPHLNKSSNDDLDVSGLVEYDSLVLEKMKMQKQNFTDRLRVIIKICENVGPTTLKKFRTYKYYKFVL